MSSQNRSANDAKNIQALTFLRTQEPERKTDYQTLFAPDDSALKQMVLQLHDALTKSMPIDKVRMIFPFVSGEDRLLCQCVATSRKSADGGRTFLELSGIFVYLQDLKTAGIHPVDLFIEMRQATVNINTKTIALSVKPIDPQGANAQEVNQYYKRMQPQTDGKAVRTVLPWPPNQDANTVLTNSLMAFRKLNFDDACSLGYALGMPQEAVLPDSVRIDFCITEKTSVAPAPVSAKSGRKRLAGIEAIADSFLKPSAISDVWRHRLWNKCQDVIAEAEVCLNFDDNLNYSQARSSYEKVDRLCQILQNEVARSRSAAVLPNLPRDISDWQYQFRNSVEGLNRNMPGGALSEKDSGEPGLIQSLFRPPLVYITAILLLILIAGGGFLCAKRLGYLPDAKSSQAQQDSSSTSNDANGTPENAAESTSPAPESTENTQQEKPKKVKKIEK